MLDGFFPTPFPHLEAHVKTPSVVFTGEVSGNGRETMSQRRWPQEWVRRWAGERALETEEQALETHQPTGHRSAQGARRTGAPVASPSWTWKQTQTP